MKRYNKNGQLETIMCNCSGKSWWCSMESSGRDVSVLTMHGIIFLRRTDRSIILICVKNVMMNWFPASRYLWTGKNRLNFCRMG